MYKMMPDAQWHLTAFPLHRHFNARRVQLAALPHGCTRIECVFKDDGPLRNGRWTRYSPIPIRIDIPPSVDWDWFKRHLSRYLEEVKTPVRRPRKHYGLVKRRMTRS
jgi:hypothetical protein